MSGRIRMLLALACGWLVIQLPRVAAACAVCTAGRDEENQLAFLLTTIFMSVLPLAVIGSVVFVLWRRIRKLEASRQDGAEAARAGETAADASRAPLAPSGSWTR